MVFSDLGFHAEEKAWGKEGSSGLKVIFLVQIPWLWRANMLMESEVNPFDGQEAKPVWLREDF
ncbi:hypothetical protein EPI10_022969 [Gossypium australe]|uniref:Uncharacterized protein n=1 Tax=Gossypium australe TaxID=47621 RepID=A0A5B6VU97_9ROSI|nr:hypothetical protein EPI10_022969 [Gossypium australe]